MSRPKTIGLWFVPNVAILRSIISGSRRVSKKVAAFGIILIFEFFILDFAYTTPSTHIWAPSTDVQTYKKWHLTSDFYFPSEKDAAGSRPNTITNLGLTVGVLPFKRLNVVIG